MMSRPTEPQRRARNPSLEPLRERALAVGPLLKAERKRRGLNLRDAADQVGVGMNSLSRLERGGLPDVLTFLAVLLWLRLPTRWFLGEGPEQPLGAYRRGWDDCAEAARSALEKALANEGGQL